MPTRRKLLGLTSGSALAWGLFGSALGAATRAPELTVSIQVTKPSMEVAPAGYFFEAEVLEPYHDAPAQGRYPQAYDTGFHKPLYLWRTSDAGRFEAPEHLVEAHRRKDQATGRYCGKVFETPGRHDVHVDVYFPDGRWGTSRVQVFVADPENAFAPIETIVVALDGDFRGAPAHAPGNALRTVAQAHARYSEINTRQVRILFKRGHVFNGTSRKGIKFDRQRADCLIGAWGAGAAPVIDLSAGGGAFATVAPEWADRTLVVSDLTFHGSWDPTVELWGGAAITKVLSLKADATLVMHNCRETGCAVTLDSRDPPQRSARGARIFFNEYIKTDYKDFLLLCPREGVDISITGCRVVQNPEALNGGENRRATSYALYGRNAHNFIRCSGRRLYVAACDIFIRHGWAGFHVYDNHPFRLNRNNVPGMRAIIARNHIEGMIMRQAKAREIGAFPMNILIEQNYIVDNPTVTPVMAFRSGPVTIRNNIVVEHNTAKLPKSGVAFKGFIGLYWDGVQKDTHDAPIFVYNNSFIDLKDDANAGDGPATIFNDGVYPHVYEANNLLWVPNQNPAQIKDGPLDVTSLGWDARYLGVRLGWAFLKGDRLGQDVRPGDSILFPYWTDFVGNPLSQDSFAGQAGRHALRLKLDGKAQAFDGLKGQAHFRFEAAGVVVTNRSGVLWRGDVEFTLLCDRGTTPMAMDSTYAQAPGGLSLYRPKHDAGAVGSATQDLLVPVDFLGEIRPGSAHPQAPQGRATRGAVETAVRA